MDGVMPLISLNRGSENWHTTSSAASAGLGANRLRATIPERIVALSLMFNVPKRWR